jgi:hypothetical protein
MFCLSKWQFLMISPCPSKLLYFSALLVMQVMGQRLQVTEQRQQQMMTFLAKAMQNPAFLAQLMQQSESNKRLAATVRKKRRLPKQDEGGEDSLNADSPPDGQMVTFQPNGAGEPKGARSMLMQFLNALESSSPNHDSTPLDTLFRDMSSGMSIPEMNTLNRQSGVTLTEMQMSGLPDTLPVVTDIPDESMLHISPPPSLHIPRLEGGQSIEISDEFFRTEASEHKEANDNYLDVNGESYKEEVSSNVDSPVLSSAANDTFWELFLSETLDSPVASTDPNMDAEGPSETGALLLDGGAVDDGTNVFTDLNAGDHLQAAQDNWSKENVDQLSNQMGQLTPG